MKLLISGICGKMGRMLLSCSKEQPDIELLAGIDRATDINASLGIHIYPNFSSYNLRKPDVIIDFSSTSALPELLFYAKNNNVPLVLATTGYNLEEITLIEESSKFIPIFKSGNMSSGIAALIRLVKNACTILGESADIEIIETHHSLKADAPSGTALMLADAIKSTVTDSSFIIGRNEKSGKRKDKEIGLHSIRGGTIVGKHEIQFLMNNETITIKHEAESKSIFAFGSLKAARFIINKKPGLYSLLDM